MKPGLALSNQGRTCLDFFPPHNDTRGISCAGLFSARCVALGLQCRFDNILSDSLQTSLLSQFDEIASLIQPRRECLIAFTLLLRGLNQLVEVGFVLPLWVFRLGVGSISFPLHLPVRLFACFVL